ncbi:hypothetical protein BKA70DRAFT_1227802 [Coprinopsis sp. MPI-PUGE-AT-0042]|nr:hypothetical protein BKA70DRAFT_1227802 [Coprinopsis sp. MPI-PUGE-AT-0042]
MADTRDDTESTLPSEPSRSSILPLRGTTSFDPPTSFEPHTPDPAPPISSESVGTQSNPYQLIESTTPSEAISANWVELSRDGSGNSHDNSAANPDDWGLGNAHTDLPQESHAGQAVTLGSQQYGAPYTTIPSNPSTAIPGLASVYHPDSITLGPESDNVQASENPNIQSGKPEMTLLDDLDTNAWHQPRAFYRPPNLPDSLSPNNIYIKQIYPSGHGYPGPNPFPQGPPVRIGDVGELTSSRLTILANVFDSQLSALRGLLAPVQLSDIWHEPHYLSEGQSITGGASVRKINCLPGSKVIQDIQYCCNAPQGAILAVTSPAQLHTLTDSENHRLSLWLCEHGMELVQTLNPGRADPLYIVTGKVTSSSWATATYAEPMPESDNTVVLTHIPGETPPYYWSEPGTTRNWSKASSAVNPQGERASNQCLFLRGFLLTPSPPNGSRQARYPLKSSHNIPGASESHLNMDTTGWDPRDSEGDDLLIEEIPSSSSVDMLTSAPKDFYPSHRINNRLLELTNADMAITHDDDWRFKLKCLRCPSVIGLQEHMKATVLSSVGLTAQDKHQVQDSHQGNKASSIRKQEESQIGPDETFHGVSTSSTNFASGDGAVHHPGESQASQVPQTIPTMLVEDSRASEAMKPSLCSSRSYWDKSPPIGTQ